MQSKFDTNQWFKSCVRKKKYDLRLIPIIIRKIRKSRLENLKFYKCRYCSYYHLTRNNQKIKSQTTTS